MSHAQTLDSSVTLILDSVPTMSRVENRSLTRGVLQERSSLVEMSVCPLAGRDFSHDETLDVPTQVELLIKQATSHENLCQCYIGW